MAKLTVQFSGKTIGEHELNKPEIIIGREPDCDITIDNLAISRNHCKITKKGNIYAIADLNSNNGTFINGRRITVHNLNDRDEIILGKYLLLFEDVEARKLTKDSSDLIPALADGPHTMAVNLDKIEQFVRDRASLKRARLVAQTSGNKFTVPLAKPIIMVGTLPSCDWKIQGFFVAKRQALIHVDSQGYKLVNLGNWTKIYVNGKAVEETILKTNDEIRIGGNSAKFYEEEE